MHYYFVWIPTVQSNAYQYKYGIRRVLLYVSLFSSMSSFHLIPWVVFKSNVCYFIVEFNATAIIFFSEIRMWIKMSSLCFHGPPNVISIIISFICGVSLSWSATIICCFFFPLVFKGPHSPKMHCVPRYNFCIWKLRHIEV